ncbi:MAG: hypothetical protein CM15mP65_21540 [Crocinitomicaceae bacterium]|nr:MAG: hypothetical protein CM15mP65_21540 [Crocinitomicaceae bacterium]
MAEEKETSVNEDQSAVEKKCRKLRNRRKTTSSISDKIDLEKLLVKKVTSFT